jgi:hypothetical protein
MSSSYPTTALQQPSRVEQLRVLAAIHGDIDDGDEDLCLDDESASTIECQPELRRP